MLKIKRLITVSLMFLISNIFATIVLAKVDGPSVFGNIVFGEKEEHLQKELRLYQKDWLKKRMGNFN